MSGETFPGICDGCGEHHDRVTSFDVPPVATGICLCDPCLADEDEEGGAGR